MKPMRRRLLSAFLLLGLVALAPASAAADGVGAKAALCAVCHGANGTPVNKQVPVLWGQNEGYIYLQLRDYKLSNRKNPTMNAIAAGLDKDTMRGLAAFYAAKPWPSLGQPSAPADVARRAETINSSAACKGCHLDAWQGDSVTPHVSGQSQSYLRQTMTQFRNGERANNPWMVALLKTYTDDDIQALASFLAGY